MPSTNCEIIDSNQGLSPAKQTGALDIIAGGELGRLLVARLCFLPYDCSRNRTNLDKSTNVN